MTSSTSKQLKEEIKKIIAARMLLEKPITPAWIAHEVNNNYLDGLSEHEHKSHWLWCGYANVYNEALAVIRKMGEEENEGNTTQGTIVGFKRLQKFYVIKRNKESQMVPLEGKNRITRAEFRAKIGEMKTSYNGLGEHIEEMEDYLDNHYDACGEAEGETPKVVPIRSDDNTQRPTP